MIRWHKDDRGSKAVDGENVVDIEYPILQGVQSLSEVSTSDRSNYSHQARRKIKWSDLVWKAGSSSWVLLALVLSCCRQSPPTTAVPFQVSFNRQIPLPDSLGGRRARGEVVFAVRIVKGDRVVGYDPLEIRITTNPCEPCKSYNNYQLPDTAASRLSVRERYKQWMDDLFSHMEILVHTESSDWIPDKRTGVMVDTLHRGYLLKVNEDLEAIEQKMVTRVEQPQRVVPRSIGGKLVQGTFDVRFSVDRLGRVKCWRLVSLSARLVSADDATHYRYHEASKTYGDESRVNIFQPYVTKFARSVRFAVVPDESYFNELDSFSIELTHDFEDTYIKMDPRELRLVK